MIKGTCPECDEHLWGDTHGCPCGCGRVLCQQCAVTIMAGLEMGIRVSHTTFAKSREIEGMATNEEAKQQGFDMATAMIALTGRTPESDVWDVDMEALQSMAKQFAQFSGYRELNNGLDYVQGFLSGATSMGARLVSRQKGAKLLGDGKKEKG